MGINLRELIIRDYESRFREVSACVLVDHSGYSAEETKRLRRKMRERGVVINVVRNRLAGLAFKNIGMDVIKEALAGPVTILYGEDSVEVSKAIVDWNRSNRPLPIKGGYLEGAEELLTSKDVRDLAKLPDLDTMRAIVLGTFITPVRNVVNCFQASLASFVQCVQAHIEKVEGSTADAAEEAVSAST